MKKPATVAPPPMGPAETAMLARLKTGPVELTLDSGGARLLMAHLRVRGFVTCKASGEKLIWTITGAGRAA